jgi:hypothetical protein
VVGNGLELSRLWEAPYRDNLFRVRHKAPSGREKERPPVTTKEPPTEVIVPLDANTALVLMENPPSAVLAEAQQAARALQNVIAAKPKKVVMNGEQYLEFEDWQTLGRFYGITAQEDGDPEFVEMGDGIRGFKASAIAQFRSQTISRATAYCLTDEEKWRAKPKYEWHIVLSDGTTALEDEAPRELWIWDAHPTKPGKNVPRKERVLVGEEAVPLFQLSSMAQTRACAKALRNVLSWVVVMAGYRATPAEEIDGMPGSETVEAEVVNPPAAKPAQAPAPAPAASKPAAAAQPARRQATNAPAPAGQSQPAGGRAPGAGTLPRWSDPCPRCAAKGPVIVSKIRLGYYLCWKNATPKAGCGYEFTPADAEIHNGAGAEREANGQMFEGGR